MDLRELTPDYFVSPQIAPEDMPALKAAGFTCVICNRPDMEVPPSHQADAMRTAAEAAGLRFEVVELTHQSMVPPVIAENRNCGADTDGKVLAYCASGTRSCIAWALGQAGTQPADDIIAAARAGGYDVAHLRDILSRPFE